MAGILREFRENFESAAPWEDVRNTLDNVVRPAFLVSVVGVATGEEEEAAAADGGRREAVLRASGGVCRASGGVSLRVECTEWAEERWRFFIDLLVGGVLV